MIGENEKHLALGQFLKKKRASLTPEHVGLPRGKKRKVSGLRREEVADLANLSVDWYIRLEQGRAVQPSVDVLMSLSGALQLNRKERDYLFNLADQRLPEEMPGEVVVSSRLQQFLDAQNPCPAYISDDHWNIVGWNKAAALVFGDYARMTVLQRNSLWRAFTDPYLKGLLDNWEGHAKLRVSQLRMAHSQFPANSEHLALIDELRRQSEIFNVWWNEPFIMGTPEGKKLLHHPVVGDIRIDYLSFQTDEHPNATVTVHLASDQNSREKLSELFTGNEAGNI